MNESIAVQNPFDFKWGIKVEKPDRSLQLSLFVSLDDQCRRVEIERDMWTTEMMIMMERERQYTEKKRR